MAAWCQQQGGWDLQVVQREPGTRGFSVQPRRWVVERSFAWLVRTRRLAKDYERKVQTSETLFQITATRLLLGRLVAHIAPERLERLDRYAGASRVRDLAPRAPSRRSRE